MMDTLTPEKIMGAPIGTYIFILDVHSDKGFIFEKKSDNVWARHDWSGVPTVDNYRLQKVLLIDHVIWSMS